MSHPSPLDRHRMHELLEQYRAELLALAKEDLLRPQVSRDRAFELTGVLLPNIRALDARIGAELHPDRAAERRRQVATLEERALVLYAADLLAEQTYANTTRQRRNELVQAVKKHDRTLMNWAVALFSDNPILAEELENIRRGTGHRDDAEDTLRLVSMFRERWAQVNGQTALTKEQLEGAAEDAAELLDLLRPGHQDPARDLARRAYLAWHRDYWELQMLGRYLERTDAADAAQRFPGIRSVTSPTPAQPTPDDADASTDADADADTDADAPADDPTPTE